VLGPFLVGALARGSLVTMTGGAGAATAAPAGAAALVAGPVTTGTLIEPTSLTPVDLGAHGYVEQEFFVSGTASAYRLTSPETSSGRWTVEPTTRAFYRTRVVVRRPADPADFNGTVIVEWTNVTALESSPDWSYLANTLVSRGYAYVALSAQSLAVNGGSPLLPAEAGTYEGLKRSEPARYASLVHPGDQYAFDILSQVGRAVRHGAPGSVPMLGPLVAKRVVADGESQSAIFLTTYVDALAPSARAFDAYLIHSRGGGAEPLSGASLASGHRLEDVRIRTDLHVPVFVFETETDVGPLLDYGPARQPDTRWFRAWEVAGTAHADATIVGNYAPSIGCDFTVNQGPQSYVLSAALVALQRWMTTGTPPPVAQPLQLVKGRAEVARDSLGLALGGVRTPAVDVPVAVLSGDAPAGVSTLCSLFGHTVPFTDAQLTALYGSPTAYVARYQEALTKAVAGGFLLSADAPALLAQAEAVTFPTS